MMCWIHQSTNAVCSKDVALRLLFDKVATHWERKKRQPKTSEPPQVDEGANHHGEVPGESQAAVPMTPEAEEDEVAGDQTPDAKPKVDDEYLAWTLGGDLCPAPGFEPDTPEEKAALDIDIDEQLRQLETLG